MGVSDASKRPLTVLIEVLGIDRSFSNASPIFAAGFDEEVVRQVVDMVEAAEYKRRQSPPSIRSRPVPSTHKYLEQSSR